jgi:hypothetical protein
VTSFPYWLILFQAAKQRVRHKKKKKKKKKKKIEIKETGAKKKSARKATCAKEYMRLVLRDLGADHE